MLVLPPENNSDDDITIIADCNDFTKRWGTALGQLHSMKLLIVVLTNQYFPATSGNQIESRPETNGVHEKYMKSLNSLLIKATVLVCAFNFEIQSAEQHFARVAAEIARIGQAITSLSSEVTAFYYDNRNIISRTKVAVNNGCFYLALIAFQRAYNKHAELSEKVQKLKNDKEISLPNLQRILNSMLLEPKIEGALEIVEKLVMRVPACALDTSPYLDEYDYSRDVLLKRSFELRLQFESSKQFFKFCHRTELLRLQLLKTEPRFLWARYLLDQSYIRRIFPLQKTLTTRIKKKVFKFDRRNAFNDLAS